MEVREYETLFNLETSYWWFRALRAVLLDTCHQVGLGRSARILDAGCGTGKTVEVLRNEVSHDTYGFDVSPVAARYWSSRKLRQMCVGSVNAIPFRDNFFDAALCTDVLECDGVMEQEACRELWRVVRTGGYLIIVVPAYRWLMSPEHHRAVHAVRRYTPRQLMNLLQQFPVRPVRLTPLFATLFPVIAAYRLWRRRNDRNGKTDPRSELRALPYRVNEFLFHAVDWERLLLPFMNLPIGSSVLAVVQKRSS